jgi:hypothetical protein
MSREATSRVLDRRGALTDSGGAVFPSVMSDPLGLDNPVATVLVFGPLVRSVLAESRRFRGDSRRRFTDPTYWRLQAWQLVGLLVGVLVAKAVPDAHSLAPRGPGPCWAVSSAWPA